MTGSPQLATTLLQAEGVTPESWMLFLHGILGRGSNLRAIARGFVEARPHWGAVLVDLRQHGASQGFSPPHTVTSAATDLRALQARLPGPVRGVWGHSFGGKVALVFAQTLPSEAGLQQLWSIDSDPGSRGDGTSRGGLDEVRKVFDYLQQIQRHPLASRAAFLESARQAGFSAPMAAWLATNLKPKVDGGMEISVDVEAITAMFEDYCRLDAWAAVEAPSGGDAALHFVLGGRSAVFDAPRRQRLEAAAVGGRVRAHVIETAGHWVHTDAPAALLCLMLEATK